MKSNLTKTSFIYLGTQDLHWYMETLIQFKIFITDFIITPKCQNLSKSPRFTCPTRASMEKWTLNDNDDEDDESCSHVELSLCS